MTPHRTQWTRWAIPIGFTILLLGLPLLEGCSYYLSARRTTKKITREVITTDGDYRKRIGIARFENRSYYTREPVDLIFQQKLTDVLASACPHALLVKPGDPDYPEFLNDTPRLPDGRIDNISLALSGREQGFNAIVSGVVVDISGYEEKRGIFWLRDTHAFIQIQIHIKMFDTETGAKLLDENFTREVEVDETDYLLVKQKRQSPIAEIPQTLQFLATLEGEKICDALSGQRWKSYVLSVDGKRVILAAGRRSGLRQGMRLTVHESSKVIPGAGSEEFFLPGATTGEVQITYVHLGTSEAATVGEGNIQPGSVVKIR